MKKGKEQSAAIQTMFMLLNIYPENFNNNNKKLLSAYKEAKQNKKRTVSKIEKAKYCLYIDNVKHDPTLIDSEGEILNLIRTSLIIAVQF